MTDAARIVPLPGDPGGGPPQPRRKVAAVAAIGLAATLSLTAVGWRAMGPGTGKNDPHVGLLLPSTQVLALVGEQGTSRLDLPPPGRAALLHFWSPHCGPCREMSKDMEKLHERARTDAAVSLVAISADAVGDLRDFARNQRVHYPIAHDPKGKLHGVLGVDALPADVLVDARGRVTHVWRGRASYSALAAALWLGD